MAVTDWLLDSDPAIRWQTLRDLLDAPPDVVAAERARVATEGWGARLLDEQGDDGLWDGSALFPGGRAYFSSGEASRDGGQPSMNAATVPRAISARRRRPPGISMER